MADKNIVLSCALEVDRLLVNLKEGLPDYLLLKLAASLIEQISDTERMGVHELLQDIGRVEEISRLHSPGRQVH